MLRKGLFQCPRVIDSRFFCQYEENEYINEEECEYSSETLLTDFDAKRFEQAIADNKEITECCSLHTGILPAYHLVETQQIRNFHYSLSPKHLYVWEKDLKKGLHPIQLKEILKPVCLQKEKPIGITDKDLSTWMQSSFLEFKKNEHPNFLWCFGGLSPESIIKVEPLSIFAISRIGQIKYAYFSIANNEPIYGDSKHSFLTLDETKVSPQYLAYALSTPFTLNEIDMWRLDTAVPEITEEDLLRVRIAIPDSLEEQHLIVEQAKKELLIRQAEGKGFENLFDAKKEEFRNEVRIKKHSLGHLISSLDADYKCLLHLIERNDGILNINQISDPVYNDTVKNDMCRISRTINRIKFEVNKFTQDENRWEAGTEIPLNNFLSEYCKSYVTEERFKVLYQGIEEQTYIPKIHFSQVDLEKLLANIFDNAKRHGFTDATRTDYEILVSLQIVSDNELIVSVSNNGNPLPTGMDEKRLFLQGIKGQETGNTGLGCHDIKETVEHFNGKVKLDSNKKYPVVMQLSFSYTI